MAKTIPEGGQGETRPAGIASDAGQAESGFTGPEQEQPGHAPKHAVRATRSAGRQMRSRLLDAASDLFKEKGLGGASIADIATAADAFPSQITYYFRTKEALFVEAACRDVLYAGQAAEEAAADAATPRAYTKALTDSVMQADALMFFIEALTLTRRRQDLAPLVERTIERLHGEGLRAYAGQVAAHGWRSRLDPATSARRFWAIALGVALEGYATGRSADEMAAEMLRVLDAQADTARPERRLRVVAGRDSRARRAALSSVDPSNKETSS
jgi:AcrR family transcriptional regulator